MAALVVFLSGCTSVATLVRVEPLPASHVGADAFGLSVREIRIEGAKRTRDGFILRALATKVGARYEDNSPDEDQRQLEQLGIFSWIEFEAIPESDSLVLVVRVEEAAPVVPSISYDLSDVDGLSLGPALSATNVLGQGIYAYVATRFGRARHLQVSLSSPRYGPRSVLFDLDTFIRDRYNTLDDFGELAYEFYGRITYWAAERFAFGIRPAFLSVKSSRPGITLDGSGRDDIPTLAVFAGYDSRNAWYNATRGWRLELDAAKNGGFLGGDADYWTFTADVRRYIYLAERHSLALYGLATLQPGVVGQDIPVFGDYHLGGTNAVRGWDVDQREGKHQLLGTVEYRLLVLEPKRFRPAFLPAFLPAVSLPVGLQFAVFGDAGIVWDTASAFRWSSAVAGVGVGLRMLIPGFGMLRGDVAVGQPGFGIGLHFGVYEKAIGQRNRVR